jgi:tetratricopeptide (TPR) repeat protein
MQEQQVASKTTLNAKNLEALGSERLAALLIEISTGSAANKRRLRIELAGMQSVGEVAREVTRRLSSIDRSRSKMGWRRVKALKSDLDTQRRVIAETIARSDTDEALEVIWRLMSVAHSVFSRCTDSNGTIMAVFRLACVDLGMIAKAAEPDPRLLADRAFSALQHNDYGQYDNLIEALAPALDVVGLAHLKTLFVEWSKPAEVDLPGTDRADSRRSDARASYDDILNLRKRDRTIRTALEQIADAQGDVDAFIAQKDKQARSEPAVAAEIARRLIAAGRPEEALDAINKADLTDSHPVPFEWEAAFTEVLEALGRKDEAQEFRWQSFERTLNSDHLRAFLKRLPDFDDMEAEEKALAHAGRYPDIHHALAFMLSWPALDHAARLVMSRAAELDGDQYQFLTSSAEMLAEKFPLASIITLRAMIDFALDRARTARYRHAARHLAEAKRLSGEIKDGNTISSHEDYVANLRSRHRSKTGFWKLTIYTSTKSI